MKKGRKSYSKDFKIKLVELAKSRGNVSAVAREYSVSINSLYRWIKEYDKYAGRSFPGHGNPKMTEQEAKIAALKKELADVKEERYILKKAVHFKSRYGSERLTAELNARGICISKPTVARMMKQMNLRVRRKRKFRSTTDSKHSYRIVPNRLKRNFFSSGKGQIWVSDITYIETRAGWIYLTIILDLYDRKVVGWSISRRLTTRATVVPGWHMATINRPITKQLVFHSDRGVQYACDEFAFLLENHPLVTRSMSRKGDCWDNAVAESFFKSIKAEEVYGKIYSNRNEAEMAIFEYIEGFYNRNRRHSALGNLTIREFEKINNVA